MMTPIHKILKTVNLTNVTLLLTSLLQITDLNILKHLTPFSTLWLVIIVYFIWLIKKRKEQNDNFNRSKKAEVKMLKKFYGDAFQVEETNRKINVRPSISIEEQNIISNPPENDEDENNNEELLPTSVFLIILVTGTHICGFGIISYMFMLERTWSCLIFSVIYVSIGTIYLLLTFSYGTAERNRLKL